MMSWSSFNSTVRGKNVKTQKGGKNYFKISLRVVELQVLMQALVAALVSSGLHSCLQLRVDYAVALVYARDKFFQSVGCPNTKLCCFAAVYTIANS